MAEELWRAQIKDGVRKYLRFSVHAGIQRKYVSRADRRPAPDIEGGVEMYINDYGKNRMDMEAAWEYMKGQNNSGMPSSQFSGYVYGKEGEAASREGHTGNGGKTADEALAEEEEWREKLRKWDEEMERIREQNRRERELLQEARIRKKRIKKKLEEKLALKKYLARQDEIMQMNEKISLERAVGEDVYIEKVPLSKSLSVAEIMAICSEF